MPFPPHIDHVLTTYGIRAETKAALYDLYLSMGGEVLEVFADLADGVTSATMLEPDDTLTIREQVVERYLRRNHPRWLEGMPTASLWHPRVAEGRAAGCGRAAGRVAGERAARDRRRSAASRRHSRPRPQRAFRRTRGDDLVRRRRARSRRRAGDRRRPRGSSTRSPARSARRPGTFDGEHRLALLWEVQPNVYKPAGERNRAIAKIYRRHRNWHLITLAAALEWLAAQNATIFILRGTALGDHARSESREAGLRSDRRAARPHGRAGHARPRPDAHRADGRRRAARSSAPSVMNHALRKHVLQAARLG